MRGFSNKKFERKYEPHSALEAEVTAYLQKHGYVVEAAPYYLKFAEDVVKSLYANFDMNGIYLRSRADRVIVHKDTGFTCQLEVKTAHFANYNQTPDNEGLNLEAMPLAISIHLSKIGVKTMYVYGSPAGGSACAFWADEDVLKKKWIKKIIMPPKQDVNRNYYEKKLRDILGEHTPPIIRTKNPPKEGSGDTFAVMDFPAVRKGSSGIRDMLKEAMEEYVDNKPILNHIHCNQCTKLVDWSKHSFCDCGEKHKMTVVCRCDTCYQFFCDETCYKGHLKYKPVCQELTLGRYTYSVD